MGLREQIREQSRFKRMRMGQEAPEMVRIPSMPEIRVAMVPLNEAESLSGTFAAANADVPDNAAGIQHRQRIAAEYDVWNACREADDLAKKVWPSVEEMVADLEPSDIDSLFDELTVLMDYASPTLDGLSDKDIDELKKAFVLIDWRGLTGRRWSALKLCLSLLTPELLLARSSSTTFTPSSTETRKNPEPT